MIFLLPYITFISPPVHLLYHSKKKKTRYFNNFYFVLELYLPLVPLGSFHEEVIFMRPSSVLLLDHLHPLQLPEVVHQALCPVRS